MVRYGTSDPRRSPSPATMSSRVPSSSSSAALVAAFSLFAVSSSSSSVLFANAFNGRAASSASSILRRGGRPALNVIGGPAARSYRRGGKIPPNAVAIGADPVGEDDAKAAFLSVDAAEIAAAAYFAMNGTNDASPAAIKVLEFGAGSVEVTAVGENADDDWVAQAVDNATAALALSANVDSAPSSQPEPHRSYPPTPTLRECFTFAIPALGIYASPPLLSLIDAAFVGRMASSVELAALGPAGSISDCASLPLLFLSIAATNLVAKSNAAGDEDGSRRVTRACLGMGAVGGLILALAVYTRSGPLSALYCGEKAGAAILAPYCSSYVTIRSLALPAVVVSTIAQAVCIGIKDTRTPMMAVLLASVLNFAGDLILVPGLGLGIVGAAWATSASQICAAGLLLRVLAKRGLLRGADAKVEKEESADLLSVSTAAGEENHDVPSSTATLAHTIRSILSFVPFLFVMSVKIGMHNSCAAVAASLGGAPAAAHTALFAVAMLCFTFGDVGSSLSQAFLPAFVGEEEDGELLKKEGRRGEKKKEGSGAPPFDLAAARPTISRLLQCTFAISATVMGISTALLTVFAPSITTDPAVLHQMRKTLPLVAATLCMHGTAVTLEGLLLARRHFRGLTWTYAGVGASIAAALAAVKGRGWGLTGVWGAYVWFNLSRVLAFSLIGGLWPSSVKDMVRRRIHMPWRRRKRRTETEMGMETETTMAAVASVGP